MEADRPWYEAVGLAAERGAELVGKGSAIVGEDNADYVVDQASSLGNKVADMLLSAADVDALKPVFVVFKALFDAVKGAAANRNELIGLLGYGILIVKSMPEKTTTSKLSPGVIYALETLTKEVQNVMDLTESFAGKPKPTNVLKRAGRRIAQVYKHSDIGDIIRAHEEQFRRILAVLSAGAACDSAQSAKEVIDGIDELKATAVEGAEMAKTTIAGIDELKIAAGESAQTAKATIDGIGELKVAASDAAAAIHGAANESAQNVKTAIDGIGELKAAAVESAQAAKATIDGIEELKTNSAETMAAVRELGVPKVPMLAAVPRHAPILPRVYIHRKLLVEKVVVDLVNPGRLASAAHSLVGTGGGGKSLLASSVVRQERVLSSFKQGVFWFSVGPRSKEDVVLLLENLARELSTAPGVTRHTCPHNFENTQHVIAHLSETRNRGDLRCLVVLDNVWDAEVVSAFGGTGFHLLVTTRKRSVISPMCTGACTEVGDMTPEQALEVLGKASQAAGPVPEVEATQVRYYSRRRMLGVLICFPISWHVSRELVVLYLL